MKKLISLFIGITLLFTGCSDDKLIAPELDGDVHPNAVLKEANKKIVPIQNLTGIVYVIFSPTSPTNFWNGTIDFGEFGEYSISFFTLTQPRDPSQVSIADENFIIYELGTDWSIPGNVVLKGSTKAKLVYANKLPDPVKFLSNGKITEANGPFEMCTDRPVHIRGTVFFGQNGPSSAVGEMRINYFMQIE